MSTKIISNALLTTSVCLGLSSCWFNSAGKICDVASHRAGVCAANASGVRVDAVGNYYVRMNHIYADHKPNLMLDMHTAVRDSELSVYDKGLQWYRVNPEFGQYLTGLRSDAAQITSLKPVSDSTATENTFTKTIVQKHDQVFMYNHTSPNAGWMYLGATFEFLCVDLPISATLNAGLCCLFFMALEAESKNPSNSSTSDLDFTPTVDLDSMHAARERENAIQTMLRQTGAIQ